MEDEMYQLQRDTWEDYNDRQSFEHVLIDRKTTWGLTSQSILFAAYGVSFSSGPRQIDVEHFRQVLSYAGLGIAVITLIGVLSVIVSKVMSWHVYKTFYQSRSNLLLPQPYNGRRLQWGVATWNTPITLAPDVLTPAIVAVAWLTLLC